MDSSRLGSSYRDPSGYVFEDNGRVLRAIAPQYAKHYERLMGCGLYEDLIARDLLVMHEELSGHPEAPGAWRVIRPVMIPVITYPYEWCFSQLKDAALLTLDVMRVALDHGMILKDASAYNVQFVDCRPVFIDTLSFEAMDAPEAWAGYRQFCEQFLLPLALAAYLGPETSLILRSYVDGIPLGLGSRILPRRSLLDPTLLMHVHMHALAQESFAQRGTAERVGRRPSFRGLLALVESLEAGVRRLKLPAGRSAWSEYYSDTNYSASAMASKAYVVGEMIRVAAPRNAWDIGANDARFSEIARESGARILAIDSDWRAVDAAYQRIRREGAHGIDTIVWDLVNPSPNLGWRESERASLPRRDGPDLVIALAVIHHICIGRNVPTASFVEWLRDSAPWAIVEFVPKEDSQTKRMLFGREDVFADYDQSHFETAAAEHFVVERSSAVEDSLRVIYLLRRRTGPRFRSSSMDSSSAAMSGIGRGREDGARGSEGRLPQRQPPLTAAEASLEEDVTPALGAR